MSVVDSKLFGQSTGEGQVKLFAESKIKFFLTINKVQIEFVKDAAGKITELMLVQISRRKSHVCAD